jgi:hypothetical protein
MESRLSDPHDGPLLQALLGARAAGQIRFIGVTGRGIVTGGKIIFMHPCIFY